MGCCCSKVGGKSPKKDENVIDDEGGRESNFVNPSASPAQEYSYTNSQAKEGSNDVTYPKRPDIVAAVDGHLDGQFVTSNPMAKLRIKGGASDLPDLSGRNNATLEPQKHSENSDTNKTSQLDEENELSYESMKTRETFISENPITSTHEDRPIDSKPATITGNTTSNSDADVVQDLDYESMRTRETFISENLMISVGEMTTIVGGSNPLKSTSPLPSASLPASPPQSDAQQPLPPQSITESSPPSETKRSLLPPPISEPMAPRPNAFLSQKLRPGGILGLPVGGGGLGSLKTKVETEFIAISIPPAEERWVMSVSDQMRFIDGIRMYKPLNSECAALNIPDDRLNINHLKSILYLSGCQKGKRFTTDEYKVVRAIVDLMGPLSTAMEELFHSLSLPMKKRKLQGGPYVTYTSAQFENWKSLRDCGRADTIKDGVSGTDSMSTGGTDGVSESSASERGESTAPVIAVADSDAHEVIYFHCLAGQYLEKIQQVQTFVKQKRQSPEEDPIEQKNDEDGGAKMPRWLEVLVAKYERLLSVRTEAAAAAAAAAPGSAPVRKVPLTQGKLAAFISCCIIGKIECTAVEEDAISEVLEASNDTILQYHRDSPHETPIPRRSQKHLKYWAKRIFDFISKLAEMKSSPKDENSLNDFSLFL